MMTLKQKIAASVESGRDYKQKTHVILAPERMGDAVLAQKTSSIVSVAESTIAQNLIYGGAAGPRQNRQLDARGLILGSSPRTKRSTLLDATIAGAAVKRPYERGGVNPRDPDGVGRVRCHAHQPPKKKIFL
jgi:hypothetical protein